MEPLTISLDILQGEKNLLLGYLILTIVQLTFKYQLMIESHTLSECVQPLTTAILDGKQI